MTVRIRDFFRICVLLPALSIVACATGEAPVPTTTTSTGGGGAGGADLGPCGMDCSKVETASCTVAVCNTGQVVGPLNTCVVVPASDGTSCDDGQFCTVNDTCQGGACVGGTQNHCGLPVNPCVAVICYEDTQTCDSTPANDGASCTPKSLCEVDGECHIGECKGTQKDCTFSPLNECNTVTCDPTSGECVGTPDPHKDDFPCVLTGDLCSVNKTCKTGVCGGGKAKDCSAFDIGCQIGVCDPTDGFCGPEAAPVGSSCTEGIPECHVGTCDIKGDCIPSSGPDGVACNDHNACTKADTCGGGTCSGAAIAGCSLYLQEGFETCPSGWTFGGDWQCGSPANVGPPNAHGGMGVIATKIAGVYSISQSFSVAVADSPPIDLTTAQSPMLSFWVWQNTEGGSFDGWNLKASTNGGLTFLQVNAVAPTYNLTVAGQPAWGGNHAGEGWRNYTADLSTVAGHSVILRFAFRSDGATVFPGVYIDDVVVSEPLQLPLFISTDSPLPDVYAGMDYATPIVKTGGTSGSAWSIKPGGVNDGWLAIDPSTGVLKGAPTTANVGPVTVTIHVEEPSFPSNFAEKTFSFVVKNDAYYTSFENACPNGWTLTGDWQCGVPSGVGPIPPYVGTQCLATQLGSNYHDLQSWTTATSPDIDLTNVVNPTLSFRMWVDTEGSTYDGFNLKVSADGVNYAIVDSLTPAYPLIISGEPAWGGHQSAVGWQLVQADLSAYAGQVIRLRYAFHSDSSGNFPGVYIDDILVQ